MKIAMLESGDFGEFPDMFKLFFIKEKAIKNIPYGFKKKDIVTYPYYENEITAKWLSIKMYEVEK